MEGNRPLLLDQFLVSRIPHRGTLHVCFRPALLSESFLPRCIHYYIIMVRLKGRPCPTSSGQRVREQQSQGVSRSACAAGPAFSGDRRSTGNGSRAEAGKCHPSVFVTPVIRSIRCSHPRTRRSPGQSVAARGFQCFEHSCPRRW